MQPNDILAYFARYIESELGIIYAEHNYFQLENRLQEIARLLGLSDLEKLHAQAQGGIDGAFRDLLLDTATNNETSFFRDPAVFKAIEAAVCPAFFETGGQETVQIWSAASSTGQEALSIAMLLLEQGRKQDRPLNFRILGTDISGRALKKAQAARYTQLEVQRGLPAPMMVKYFRKDEQDHWTAAPELSQCMEFRQLNLKSPWRLSERFDLVLCRNVLIYQSVEGKIDILKRITAQLKEGAYLILGAGESLLGLSEDYELVPTSGCVIYRKKPAASLAA